ncbi:Maf family protein [soil metagenome]
MDPRIVLASRSPRRLALLVSIGLDVEVAPADVPETRGAGEPPSDMVARLAGAKARAVAERFTGALVIAADTTVAIEDEVLEKPRDAHENTAFLRRLAGRTHVVHTGHCLMLDGRSAREVRTTEVRFRPLDDAEIGWYVASGEGLDKAGGYAVQGLGACLVDTIAGCYTNVVGLSLPSVIASARGLGVRLV